MALLSEFYLSSADDATRYDTDPESFAPDRHQFKRLTDVELSILWSILRDEEWDSDLLDEFEMVHEADGGERLIIRMPKALLSAIEDLPPDLVLEAAEVWADTEELQCEAAEMQPVLEALAALSRRAGESGKNVYLWISV